MAFLEMAPRVVRLAGLSFGARCVGSFDLGELCPASSRIAFGKAAYRAWGDT